MFLAQYKNKKGNHLRDFLLSVARGGHDPPTFPILIGTPKPAELARHYSKNLSTKKGTDPKIYPF
jgi:hypothetical protein